VSTRLTASASLPRISLPYRSWKIWMLIGHGRHDRFVPVTHGEWLARRVARADVRISADDGHLTLVTERVPDVHEWLMARF
jgi:pimeloyl-ACP methyl ester carboxylesterase